MEELNLDNTQEFNIFCNKFIKLIIEDNFMLSKIIHNKIPLSSMIETFEVCYDCELAYFQKNFLYNKLEKMKVLLRPDLSPFISDRVDVNCFVENETSFDEISNILLEYIYN